MNRLYLLFVLLFWVQINIIGQISSVLIDSAIVFADAQLKLTLIEMNNDSTLHPNQIDPQTGNWEFSSRTWWTSGFFSGAAWYMYELTNNDPFWQGIATSWTADLEQQKNDVSNHDVGFQIFNSYGNAYRTTLNPDYKDIIITAANSLATRYDPTIGSIRSWSWGSWNYPVIIDNMMNLELLLWASENGGDERLKSIAINHANKTLENHVREDGSTYHVIDYNNDGTIKAYDTHQGFNIESTWSRGQAWGLYGFTVMYRYTKDEVYLEAAKKLADYFIDNLPNDFVPYSDFEDPNIPNVSKDASAAAIASSALFELSKYLEGEKYTIASISILNSLLNNYLVDDVNYGSVIKRACTRSGDVERGIIYADYYFLEALLRYKSTITDINIDERKINYNFELYQNYPNPFNPSTLIKYNLFEESFVKLNIYSAVGEKISTPINNKQSAGFHSFVFNVDYLANGVYYYQLISNNNSLTKKMIFLQ